MSVTPLRKASPLTIFCGKGGVGKTSMALAFALWHAEQGRVVLVVTSHPMRELAVSFSLAGLKEAHPQAAANLFITHLDPHDILANKVKQVIPSDLLAKKVLASPIYKSLIEVAPGLKEIAFLGRLHELAEQRSVGDKTKNFDLLVWDAPATGHFLQTMKVSQSFEMYLSGPFALLGGEVADFFAEASNFGLFLVTTLEEMAVEETLELFDKLAKEVKIHPSSLICNLASPLLALSDSQFDAFCLQVAGGGLSEALKFILERHEIERSLFRRLRSSIEIKIYIVQRKAAWSSDLALLWDLSRQLDGLVRNGL